MTSTGHTKPLTIGCTQTLHEKKNYNSIIVIVGKSKKKAGPQNKVVIV